VKKGTSRQIPGDDFGRALMHSLARFVFDFSFARYHRHRPPQHPKQGSTFIPGALGLTLADEVLAIL